MKSHPERVRVSAPRKSPRRGGGNPSPIAVVIPSPVMKCEPEPRARVG